jgi:hypothetical protein
MDLLAQPSFGSITGRCIYGTAKNTNILPAINGIAIHISLKRIISQINCVGLKRIQDLKN